MILFAQLHRGLLLFHGMLDHWFLCALAKRTIDVMPEMMQHCSDAALVLSLQIEPSTSAELRLSCKVLLFWWSCGALAESSIFLSI